MKRIRKKLKQWKQMSMIYRDRFEIYGRKIGAIGDVRNAFRELVATNIIHAIANNIPDIIEVQIEKTERYMVALTKNGLWWGNSIIELTPRELEDFDRLASNFCDKIILHKKQDSIEFEENIEELFLKEEIEQNGVYEKKLICRQTAISRKNQ